MAAGARGSPASLEPLRRARHAAGLQLAVGSLQPACTDWLPRTTAGRVHSRGRGQHPRGRVRGLRARPRARHGGGGQCGRWHGVRAERTHGRMARLPLPRRDVLGRLDLRGRVAAPARSAAQSRLRRGPRRVHGSRSRRRRTRGLHCAHDGRTGVLRRRAPLPDAVAGWLGRDPPSGNRSCRWHDRRRRARGAVRPARLSALLTVCAEPCERGRDAETTCARLPGDPRLRRPTDLSWRPGRRLWIHLLLRGNGDVRRSERAGPGRTGGGPPPPPPGGPRVRCRRGPLPRCRLRSAGHLARWEAAGIRSRIVVAGIDADGSGSGGALRIRARSGRSFFRGTQSRTMARSGIWDCGLGPAGNVAIRRRGARAGECVGPSAQLHLAGD